MTEVFTILCVDDESENVSMMMRILKDNYSVLGAHSAIEGLEILKTNKIHAIISDQRMPGMTGLEFLHEVRKTDEQIILIILTAYADLSMVIEAVNHERIQGYFQKPMQAGELLTLLKREFARLRLEQENKLLLQQTQSLNEELKKLNCLKSDFLRILSHEIRTPLTALVGCLDFLKPGKLPGNSGEYETLWNLARNSTNDLHALLVDVLFLLELENLEFKVKPQAIAIRKLMKLMLKKFQAKLEDKSLHLEEDFASDLKVQVDPDVLTRIMNKLLDNAVEFSPQGGVIKTGFCLDGETLRIWVMNSGGKCYPEFHENVFQMAGKSNSLSGRSIIGTGINLAIAKILVEAHGGTINLNRSVDAMDTVLLKLPLSAEGRAGKHGLTLTN
ncbi:MAG: hybrid sensor histidine kinase/response regulator [Candidatus Riflebacteria bacterium]|nr:hybrid sensor histidine kinase/response regulator [Candidatus Riflebacteria bacterium]